MEYIASESHYYKVIADSKPSVLLFKAQWCGDCRYIEPFMPEVEASYQERLSFYTIDRDQLPELSQQLGILGIPSFLVYRHNQELIRFVSKLRKTREEIERFLDRAVTVAAAMPPLSDR